MQRVPGSRCSCESAKSATHGRIPAASPSLRRVAPAVVPDVAVDATQLAGDLEAAGVDPTVLVAAEARTFHEGCFEPASLELLGVFHRHQHGDPERVRRSLGAQTKVKAMMPDRLESESGSRSRTMAAQPRLLELIARPRFRGWE
jgi:hypothetical protein